jgi:CheY-like chemotaxis protein
LIVEDELINYELITYFLNPIGVKIEWVQDCKDAFKFIEKFNKSDNCIVLMDIKLPVMDGYEAHRKIKSIRPEIPVIAVTAYAQNSDKQKIIEEGFNGYISKPIKKQELYEILKQVFARKLSVR